LTRLRDLIDRYPLRGIKGPMGTAQDMLDCSTVTRRSWLTSNDALPTSSDSQRFDQRRQYIRVR